MAMADSLTTAPKALEACLDVLLRMIPDYCTATGADPCTDRQHDKAIAAAARALYGRDKTAWPQGVRDAATGKFD